MKTQCATRKFFPCYHIFLFRSHFVLFFVVEWVTCNFRTKWQSRLWVVLPPTPRSPHKICDNKLHVTGEWLRRRLIGLGTPQISRSLVHIQPACVWWMVYFRMGRLMAYVPWDGDLSLCPQEMVIQCKLGLLQLAFSFSLFWPDLEMALQQSRRLSGWPRSVVGHCGKAGLLWLRCASSADTWKVLPVTSNWVFLPYF